MKKITLSIFSLIAVLALAGCTTADGPAETTDDEDGGITITQVMPDGTEVPVGNFGTTDKKDDKPEPRLKGMVYAENRLIPTPLTAEVGIKLIISSTEDVEHHPKGEGPNCEDLEAPAPIKKDESYEYIFEEPGECRIVDQLNPDIVGVITIEEPAEEDTTN